MDKSNPFDLFFDWLEDYYFSGDVKCIELNKDYEKELD